MNLTAFREAHLRLMNRIESRYRRPMYEALKSQYDAFISDMQEHGIDHARRNMEKVIINTNIANVIRTIHTEVGVFFANRTLTEINKSAREEKSFGFNEQWVNDILNYFKYFLLDKAVLPITGETKSEILDVLNEGAKKGWGYDRIAQEIQSLPKWRALRIVRTEAVAAMGYGQELGARTSKYETTERWIATRDARTRHSHMAVNGDVIDTGGRFKVPIFKRIGKVDVQIGFDLMKGPGDRTASAGNIINCRCTKVTRARRDEEGNLILKRGVTVIKPGKFVRQNQIVTI
jgi:peroxiredoxin family protein